MSDQPKFRLHDYVATPIGLGTIINIHRLYTGGLHYIVSLDMDGTTARFYPESLLLINRPNICKQNVSNNVSNLERKSNMKVFISQPMKNLSSKEIKAVRECAAILIRLSLGEDVEIIDSYIEEAPTKEDFKPLYYLAESIKKLADADVAYFVNDWSQSNGCLIEHKCCELYNIKRHYMTITSRKG